MASGDTLSAWLASQGTITPTTGAPVLYSTNSGFSSRIAASLDLDSVYEGFLENYAGGGVTVQIWYTMSAANTTDNVVFGAAFQDLAAGESLASVTWTENTVVETVPNTANEVGLAEITFTDGADMDSVGNGDPFRLRVRALMNNGSTTAAGDCWIFRVKVIET